MLLVKSETSVKGVASRPLLLMDLSHETRVWYECAIITKDCEDASYHADLQNV